MTDRDAEFEKYRVMFARHPLARISCNGRPVAEYGIGWLPLIDRCLTELESFGIPFEVRQIKEKFGDSVFISVRLPRCRRRTK